MQPKKLFINYSDSNADTEIAARLLKHLYSTGKFDENNIHERKSNLAGNETAYTKELMKQEDGVLHLLSADFFQPNIECYALWKFSLGLEKGKLFPILIRDFGWKVRDDLKELLVLPADEHLVRAFIQNDTSLQDTAMKDTVVQIFERLDIPYEDMRGTKRTMIRLLALATVFIGTAAACTIWFFLHDWGLVALTILCTGLIATFLLILLHNSNIVSLQKPKANGSK